jgi:hypothetical protein
MEVLFILVKFKKLVPLMFSLGLVFSLNLQADTSVASAAAAVSGTGMQYASLDPEKNQQFKAETGYGAVSLSENPEDFVSTASYSTADYQLIDTFYSSSSPDRADHYGVTKMYKSKKVGDDIVAFETSANVKAKSGYGISKYTWEIVISDYWDSYKVNDWSPKGSNTITTAGNYAWSINPSAFGVSAGSISGTFGTKKGTISGFAQDDTYTLIWYGSKVNSPDVVYLGGAVAYQQQYQASTIWAWTYNWSY